MASTNKLRTGVGLAYDLPVTRDEYPNPVLSPSSDYIGYAVGANYDMGRHVVGAAFNWGKFTNDSSSAELAAGTLNTAVKKAYAGKYGLEIFTLGVDYQFRY
jgi:predicted porin